MTPHRFSSLLTSVTQRLAFREWLLLACVLTFAALGLGWQNGLGRADLSLYDLLLTANGRAARSDIIIVAIDDYSISQLGRWPWPRALHAQLLQKILPAAPRRVGLDVILTEPEKASSEAVSRNGDLALSAALQAQSSVLPVISANTGAGLVMLPPIPMLACAAAALGHINLQLDNDGVLRSFTPYKGNTTQRWPHFALALSLPLPSRRCSSAATVTSATSTPDSEKPIRIAFSGGSGHFKSVPYVSVLRGEVPAQFFHDKYVLIGATALGMADSYPTPVSGLSGAMSGIEINANILAGLLDHKTILAASAAQTALFCGVPVLLAFFGYLLLSPRLSLLCNLLLLPVTLGFSWLMLRLGIWLPPAAALVVLLLSYPLWSWRRLEAAIAYLGQEFIRLEQEPHLLPETAIGLLQHPRPLQDLLERRIRAMRNAVRRVRDLRQFVSDSLNSFPDVALVTTPSGRVLLRNRHATGYLEQQQIHGADHSILPQLFGGLSAMQAVNQATNPHFRWPDLLDLKRVTALTDGVTAQDSHGHDLLIKSAPCYSANHELTGWIISLVDISTIRAAERSRDETLRFLSHDMRAPQASILALLELQTEATSALPQKELFVRIEKAARKTLGLADNFVQLARAESQEYRLEEVSFQDLLLDAVDEMWVLAKTHQIRLRTELHDNDLLTLVDRTLLTRALANLISNAIHYSPAASQIVCSAQPGIGPDDKPELLCVISDQGYGIAADDQPKLFQRFQRLRVSGQPRQDGIGLGLVFVKTVVERHGGQISFTSQVGIGTSFAIRLPLFDANL